MTWTVTLDPHPLLEPGILMCALPAALGAMESPAALLARLCGDVRPPEGLWPEPAADARAVKDAVRQLLRHGGFKPSGRNKPASEYLVQAAAAGALGSINPVVDVNNVASLWSGLPMSVVDGDRLSGALRIAVAPAETSYVFNRSGQVIDVRGLCCLFDGEGACANPVKDAQRTKTDESTRRTLTVVWGTRALPGRTAAALALTERLLAELGARTERWEVMDG